MARLFGFLGNRTDLGACIFRRHRSLLQWRRAADEPVGWGLGFYQAGEILLRRRPNDDRELIDPTVATEDLRTDLVVAHIRRRGIGSLRTENTQPFRYRSWLFAQTGNLPDIEHVRQRLLDSLPEFLRRNVRGETDGELVFYLLLASLQQAGHLSDLGVTNEAIRAALRATLERVDEVVEAAGFGAPALNAIVSNGERFVVANRGAPMVLRCIEGAAETSGLLGEGDSCRPQTPNLEATRFSLIASDHDGEFPKGFAPIKPRSLISVDRKAPPGIEPI